MVTDKVEFDPKYITKNKEEYLRNRLIQLEKLKEKTKILLADYNNVA